MNFPAILAFSLVEVLVVLAIAALLFFLYVASQGGKKNPPPPPAWVSKFEEINGILESTDGSATAEQCTRLRTLLQESTTASGPAEAIAAVRDAINELCPQ